MLGDLYGGRPAEPTGQPTDAALTESVERALDTEVTRVPGQVRSRVQDGWVMLELEGVQGVDNQVRLSDR